ncbi:pyrimidine-nucleoside phosphorylase [soil metagenome]
MNVPELIRQKREGGAIDPAELKLFIDEYVAGRIEAYQVSAFLMAVFFKGMTQDEATALTQAMIESGERFDLSSIAGAKVDKHSTGGVGDKISLILAPLVAAAGAVVPMVSGRALGHTGGTLDKLDSIPGYRWSLSGDEFKKQLAKVGCAIIGQTENFVPADRKLYALRDVTGTVESIPLICASILSKKVAAGTDSLVMDVKAGNGAFMPDLDRSRQLAQQLVAIGGKLGKKVRAVLTQMSQPTGMTIGNALEIRESIDVLKGGGPADTREITLQLSAEMLVLGGVEKDHKAAYDRLARLLDNGKALEKFTEWMTAQGGNPRIVDNDELLVISKKTHRVKFARSGYVKSINTRQLGIASNTLGAGRIKVTDTVDTSVGIVTNFQVGAAVNAREDFITLFHNDRNVDEVERMVRDAYEISDEPVAKLPLILEKIG